MRACGRRLAHLVSAVTVIALGTSLAGATDYYVATNGSNNNPGTLNQPFLTIQQAANAAHAGDNVYVLQGTYRETVTVPNSGTALAPITFQPYRGAQVTITGLDVLESSWSPYSGSTYSTNLAGGASQVFVNGKMMNMARFPNAGYDNPLRSNFAAISAASIQAAPANSTIASTALAGAGNFTGARIASASGGEYVAVSAPVTSQSGDTLEVQWPSGYSNPVYAPKVGNDFYLYGSLAALNAPKEWYSDNASSTLYLQAPGGVNPATQTVEIRARQLGFDIGNFKTYIQVQGFRLQAAGIGVAGNYNLVDNVQVLYGDSFTDPAGWNGPNDPAAVRISGHHNALRNSEIAYAWGDGVRLAFTNNTVNNNVIHDVDWSGTDAAFVNADDSGGKNTITNNTMYNAGRSGVTFRYTNPDTVIQNNDIARYGFLTSDLGGIYTFLGENNGTVVANNRVADSRATGTNAGIYLDVDSTGVTAHHNLVTNANIGVLAFGNTQGPNKIYNNTLWNVGTATLAGGGGYTNINTVNNLSNNGAFIGATVGNNWSGSDPFVDPAAGDYTLRPGTGPVNYGTVLSGITDGYTGAAPDAGAFESGVPAWSAGADWSTWTFSNQAVAPLTSALYVTQGGARVSVESLIVGNTSSTSNNNRVFLEFDLSNVSGEIASAHLRLYENDVATSATGAVKLLRVLSDWDLASVTYDQPVDEGTSLSGFYDPANLDLYTEVDVTSMVLGWLADPSTNFGFSLRGTEGLTATAKFFDGFYGVTAPQLVITYAPSILAGDVNFDGVVNIFDVNLVSAHWGETGPAGDANADMTVDIFDINLISANWTPIGAAGGVVPEPSSAALLTTGLLGLAALLRAQYRSSERLGIWQGRAIASDRLASVGQ